MEIPPAVAQHLRSPKAVQQLHEAVLLLLQLYVWEDKLKRLCIHATQLGCQHVSIVCADFLYLF